MKADDSRSKMGKSRQIRDLEVYDGIPELAFSRFAI
jgi:hypothetical protein